MSSVAAAVTPVESAPVTAVKSGARGSVPASALENKPATVVTEAQNVSAATAANIANEGVIETERRVDGRGGAANSETASTEAASEPTVAPEVEPERVAAIALGEVPEGKLSSPAEQKINAAARLADAAAIADSGNLQPEELAGLLAESAARFDRVNPDGRVPADLASLRIAVGGARANAIQISAAPEKASLVLPQLEKAFDDLEKAARMYGPQLQSGGAGLVKRVRLQRAIALSNLNNSRVPSSQPF